MIGLYGHTHYDEIFLGNLQGDFVVSGLMTPSFLADNHNPSFRVYHYDTETYKMLDYDNY